MGDFANARPLERSTGRALWMSAIVFVAALVALLSIVMSPDIGVAAAVGAIVALFGYAIVRQPTSILGLMLAIIPVHFLAVLLGKLFGFPHMTVLSVCTKEVPFLLLAALQFRRNGFHAAAADRWLLAFVVLTLLRASFTWDSVALIDDLGFVIPYFVGRVTVLTDRQEHVWSKAAVAIAVVLSILGMVEVFILGDGPRKLLYAAISADEDLPTSFRATGFEGLRAGSTMAGPLVFGAFCMVALIIWWVYFRNPVPAAVIGAGLVATLTRSAILGAAVALVVLAYRMGQRKRLLTYALAMIVAIAVSIPIFGIQDYVSFTRSGQDESAAAHGDSMISGLRYVIEHPFGSGAGSVGQRTVQRDVAALNIESTFLTLAAEYGIVSGLLFLVFLVSVLRAIWRVRTRLSYLATAILIGIGIMMLVLPIYQDFRLNCWIWFPIGMAVRSAVIRTLPSEGDESLPVRLAPQAG